MPKFFAGLNLTEVFQKIKRLHRVPNPPTKMNFVGNSISGSPEIANTFNQHLASVFKKDTSPLSLQLVSAEPTICLEDIHFTKKVDDSKLSFGFWVIP